MPESVTKRRRLQTLKPRVEALPPRIGAAQRPVGAWGTSEQRGSRHERGYGTEWERTRLRILARDHELCQPCMRAGLVTTGRIVDHIVPQAEGGSGDDSNLQTICPPCHKAKTAREARRGLGYDAPEPAAGG